MILISTLRKMIKKDPAATVVQVTVKPHQAKIGVNTFEFPGQREFFATDRQAGHFQIEHAEIMRSYGVDPANLISVCDVPANEAAKVQGFDFSLLTRSGGHHG